MANTGSFGKLRMACGNPPPLRMTRAAGDSGPAASRNEIPYSLLKHKIRSSCTELIGNICVYVGIYLNLGLPEPCCGHHTFVMTTEEDFRRNLLIRKATSDQAIRRSSLLVKGSKRILERIHNPPPRQNGNGNVPPPEPVDIRQASRELRSSSQTLMEKSKDLREKITSAAKTRAEAEDKRAA